MELDLPRDFTYLVQELTRTRLALETIPQCREVCEQELDVRCLGDTALGKSLLSFVSQSSCL